MKNYHHRGDSLEGSGGMTNNIGSDINVDNRRRLDGKLGLFCKRERAVSVMLLERVVGRLLHNRLRNIAVQVEMHSAPDGKARKSRSKAKA